MLINYFTVILRNIYKNRLFAGINVLGLALAYAAFLLIAIFLHFHTTFERFHKNSSSIYRPVYSYDAGNGYAVQWARVPVDYINELPEEFPEVKKLIRFQNHEQKYLRVRQDKFRPDHAYVTDTEAFEVFDLPMIAGNPKEALKEPNSVVLTESTAVKYFGGTDVLGEELFVLSDWNPEEIRYRVTGVIRDLPKNTHLPIELLFSFKNKEERSGWAYVYILLDENADIEHLAGQMSDFVGKHRDAGDPGQVEIEFQPLEDIHLRSDLAREIVPNGSVEYVRIFLFTGLFILLIAWINYTNLQSAMVIGRIKENGLRRIFGAEKHQVAGYVLLESVTFHFFALLIACLITFLIYPYFRSLTGIDFTPEPILFSLFVSTVVLTGGFVSGLYPLWTLTGKGIIESIKPSGDYSTAGSLSKVNMKKVLISFQFIISVLLIGSALIARDQFRFLNKSNLGITKEQILALPGVSDKVKDGYPLFKEQVRALSNVRGVSACMEVPSREIRDAGPVLVKGVNTDPESAPVMDIQVIDHDYLWVLDAELIAGENLPMSLADIPVPEFNDDYGYIDFMAEKRQAYLINETAARKLGWQTPEEAVGKEISWSIGDIKLGFGPVTGVVKDYHQETLKNTIDPTVMVYEPVWLRTFLVKLDTENIRETVGEIQAVWDRLFSQYPFEYFFLDDMYEALYKNDRLNLELLYLLSGLAIIISFIGLFGLIAFSLKTRFREIALRKVLGADTKSLIILIGKEYFYIFFFAVSVAVPVSYHFISRWLENFAYRTDIFAMNYVLTILFMLLLIVLTVGFQTLRTSLINPADTLREE